MNNIYGENTNIRSNAAVNWYPAVSTETGRVENGGLMLKSVEPAGVPTLPEVGSIVEVRGATWAVTDVRGAGNLPQSCR